MAGYGTIYKKFWRNGKVRQLSAEQKAVALYLLAGPQVGLSGLYYLSPGMACEDIFGKTDALTLDKFTSVLDFVTTQLGWHFDAQNNVICISHWWKYHSIQNPNQAQWMSSHLDEIHSPLVDVFVDESRTYGYEITKTDSGYQFTRTSWKETRSETRSKTDSETTITITNNYNNKKSKVHQPPRRAKNEPDGGELNATVDVVVQTWNETQGVRTVRKLTPTRRKALTTRLKESDWPWREALAKFPLPCFAEDPNGWVPTFDWFCRPDTVNRILEEDYDWHRGNGHASKPQPEDDRPLWQKRGYPSAEAFRRRVLGEHDQRTAQLDDEERKRKAR